MSRAAAKAALSTAFESGVRNMAKNAADNIAEVMIKNSDSVLDTAIRQTSQQVLETAVRQAFPEITQTAMENLAKNSDDIITIARQGVDELPSIASRVTTQESKALLQGAENLAKRGDLGRQTVDQGTELGEQAAKEQGGLLNFIKNNPKLLIVGLTVTGLALYIGINAANGISPLESLRDIANLAGGALTEVAGLVGGLAASLASPLLGELGKFLKTAGIVIAVVVVGVVLIKVVTVLITRKKNKKKEE